MPETIKKPAKASKPTKASRPTVTPKKGMDGVNIDTAHAKTPKPTGRPSKYNPEIARIICEQLSEGIPLRQICRENEGFPAWRTVYDWMGRDPELSASIARARDIGYDAIAEECLHIADNQTITERVTETEDPKTKAILRSVIRSDDVNARRLQVETRLKLLAKFHPTKYGDKLGLHGVEGAAAIKTEDTNANKFLEVIRNMEMSKRAG
jgi:hypothetical protein